MAQEKVTEDQRTEARPLVGIVFQEGGMHYAVCLNHYLMTMARSRDEIPQAIRDMLRSYVAACAQQGVDPFEDLRPAPDKYWRMFLESRGIFAQSAGEEVAPELLAYEFRESAAA